MTLHLFTVGVVDDDPRILESLEELLAAGGYRAILFSSAEAFLKTNGFQQVDCLVCDIGLPGMNGWDLLRVARADHPKLPIILITARDEEHASNSLARRNGARHLFRKPFDGSLFLATLSDILRPI